MSPLNPAADPPPVQQRAVTAVKQATRRHERTIEVSILGVVMGVVAVLSGATNEIGALIVVVFIFGALIEALAMRGK